MKTLSVRQPYAWLIFHGKDIENRSRPFSHRGPLLIHASKGITRTEWNEAFAFVMSIDPKLASKIPQCNPPSKREVRQHNVRNELLGLSLPQAEPLILGAIIGSVNVIDCVTSHHSPWFQGEHGLVLEDPTPFDRPIPAKGSLGLWEWEGLL